VGASGFVAIARFDGHVFDFDIAPHLDALAVTVRSSLVCRPQSERPVKALGLDLALKKLSNATLGVTQRQIRVLLGI